MFLWPSTTPGSVCTSTSCRAARCVRAKLRIWVCANLMSSITPCGKACTQLAISLSESLKEVGDHLSNFSEYLRTAASPRAAMSERIASTVVRTCALLSAFASADWPDLRCRIMTGSPNQFRVDRLRRTQESQDFHPGVLANVQYTPDPAYWGQFVLPIPDWTDKPGSRKNFSTEGTKRTEEKRG